MKKERYILWHVLLLMGAMLSSCGVVTSVPLISSATPLSIETVTPTPKMIPILFSAERMNTGCVHSGESTPIKFIFRNVTNRAVSIRNSFSLSPYLHDVMPTIIDEKGNRFVDSRSLMIVDQFPDPSTPAFQKIAPNSNFEIVISYFVPTGISPAPSLDWSSTPTSGPVVNAAVPKAGNYFVTFQYLSNGLSSDTNQIWDGIVESNPVEICIR